MEDELSMTKRMSVFWGATAGDSLTHFPGREEPGSSTGDLHAAPQREDSKNRWAQVRSFM
jgi:hypothetical protein